MDHPKKCSWCPESHDPYGIAASLFYREHKYSPDEWHPDEDQEEESEEV